MTLNRIALAGIVTVALLAETGSAEAGSYHHIDNVALRIQRSPANSTASFVSTTDTHRSIGTLFPMPVTFTIARNTSMKLRTTTAVYTI